MRQRHFIDSHKAATALAVIAMIEWHDQWHNPTALLYLAMHGTYGFLWVIKSRAFPDRSWEERCSAAYGLLIWGGLSLYWIAPWLITSRALRAPAGLAALLVALYAFGLFLHFASDMQKHTALRLRPGVLIRDGLWARCRNPNYLGELCIYLGFGLLAWHWLPVAVLLLFVAVVWLPNMIQKERSLARYPDFDAYRRQSWFFVPPIW